MVLTAITADGQGGVRTLAYPVMSRALYRLSYPSEGPRWALSGGWPDRGYVGVNSITAA